MQANARKPKRPTPLSILEALGYKFSLDYDDALEITEPEELNDARLRELLRDSSDYLRFEVKDRAQRSRRVCVGGPFDGAQHVWPHCYPLNDASGNTLSYYRAARQVKRGKWAAYALSIDGRAWYAGEATNERAAISLAAKFRVPT